MPSKIFNVRLNEDDQEHIKTIRYFLEENYIYPGSLVKKITDTDTIKYALDNTVYHITDNRNF